MQIATSQGQVKVPNNIGSTTGLNSYLVSDLLEMALKQIGVGVHGNSLAPEDLKNANMLLNTMLAQWQNSGFLSPCRVDMAFQCTGKKKYLIGPGGDLDIPIRPAKLTAAYCRLLNGATAEKNQEFSDQYNDQFQNGENSTQTVTLDYPLQFIKSYEEYAQIPLKNIATFPAYIYYNPSYPLGEVYLYPVAYANVFSCHIVYPEFLNGNIKLDTQLSLPPEYWEGIIYGLAVRLSVVYGKRPDPVLAQLAEDSERVIRLSNFRIGRMRLPRAVTSCGSSTAGTSYEIFNGYW